MSKPPITKLQTVEHCGQTICHSSADGNDEGERLLTEKKKNIELKQEQSETISTSVCVCVRACMCVDE